MKAGIGGIGGVLGLVLLAAGGSARGAEFTKLYNGKDLTGWHVESGRLEAWKASGEMISCSGRGGGYLARDEEYGDFELRLEYRLPPAGNSGVGLRFPRGGWPSTQGMEIQLLDDAHPRYKDLKPEHGHCSIYTFVAANAKAAARPAGEWNRIEIRCAGPEITIRLNGVEVLSVNVEQSRQNGKGDLPLAKRPRKGLIGLQSHGDPVDFRSIEIRRL